MGTVNITLTNGALGSVLQTSDGIAGMVVTGTNVSGGIQVNTPVLLTGMASLAENGMDESNNAFAFRQVKEFYNEAGDGAMLYFMIVTPQQKITDVTDPDDENSVIRLLDFARGEIKLLGVMTDDVAVAAELGEPIDNSLGINVDVYDAASDMQRIVTSYFNGHKPFRAIIGGTSYNGDVATLDAINSATTLNGVAILVGDSQTGAGACLGLLLGRLSAIPVMRKVSRVRTGPVSNKAAWVGSTRVEEATGNIATIAHKGFITWCAYPNVSGFFFSGDGTYSADTDDYHFLARGRVIDKAHILAYTTFVQEVDDEVPVNDDGTLDAGFCKWLSQQIVNQVNNTMTVNKEISSVSCFIDPAQNILSTNNLNVVLRIVPVGYATDIEISLGFENPAL